MNYIIVAILDGIEFFDEVFATTAREAVKAIKDKHKCEVLEVYEGWGTYALPTSEWA